MDLQRREIKIASVFIVIGILLGSIVAYAATPSSTFWITSGVYPGAPSYTIFREGSNYFAKDANGQIDYSGTNASQVINNAIQPNTQVYLVNGVYETDSSILLDEANATLISDEWAVIQCSANVPVINVTRPSGEINYNIIRGLKLLGKANTETNAHGIWTYNDFGLVVEDVYISNCRVGIYLLDSQWSKFHNIRMEAITEWGTSAVWRGIYMDAVQAPPNYGSLTYFSDVKIYEPTDVGVMIVQAEIVDMSYVIVAGPSSVGFWIQYINSYAKFRGCESDTTGNYAWYVFNNPSRWLQMDLIGCFGRLDPSITSKAALFIHNSSGIKVIGGEWRAGNSPVVHLKDSSHIRLDDMEIRAHDLGADPTPNYNNGIWLQDADYIQISNVHIMTVWATSSTYAGIKEDYTEADCSGLQIANVIIGYEGTLGFGMTIDSNMSMVSNSYPVNYQTTALAWGSFDPDTNLNGVFGDGTEIVVYTSDSGGSSRLYIKTNAQWDYLALT